MNKELMQKLNIEFPDHEMELEILITYLDKLSNYGIDNESSIKFEDYLEKSQSIVNTLYGYNQSDVLVEVQVVINQYRNRYNIPDNREVIFRRADGEYVQ